MHRALQPNCITMHRALQPNCITMHRVLQPNLPPVSTGRHNGGRRRLVTSLPSIIPSFRSLRHDGSWVPFSWSFVLGIYLGKSSRFCFVLFFSRREFAQKFVVVVVGGGQMRGVVYLRAHSRWPFEWTWAIRPTLAASPAVFDAVCRREKARPFRSQH